jgi:hypothetical protein
MFRDIIDVKTNVKIIARDDRGKKVPGLCREGHNIWVNLGRQYLAEVISPLNSSFAAHYADSPIRVTQYMALGIGGNSQLIDDIAGTYPTLDTHYPGQNTFDDTVLTVPYLERPVKVSGVAGVGTLAGVWMNSVTAPPTFGGSPITKVTFDCLFNYTDINLGGAYPSVPLSEIGLMLSNQQASRTSQEVYDYSVGAHPEHINYSTRQRLIAYNTFDTISKTVAVAFEVYWEIVF